MEAKPNAIRMPLAVHNLHGGPEKSKKRRHITIKMFLGASAGGMGGFNELRFSDRLFMRREAKKRGLKFFRHGKNGAVWDPTMITVRRKRIRKILSGGYVGADGVATARKGDDDRRVGPNRYAIHLDCTALAVDLDFEWVISHFMARSFTIHRWRIPLFRKSVAALADGIEEVNGLLTGDLNSKEFVNLPEIKDVPVHTPPTHGKSRYDQILRWGPRVDVNHVYRVSTPSDHWMLVAVAVFHRLAPRR